MGAPCGKLMQRKTSVALLEDGIQLNATGHRRHELLIIFLRVIHKESRD